MPGSPRAKTSQYAQVAAELRTEILTGQLPSGSALPSEDRLAVRRGVSRVTIRAALAVLRSEGLITTVRGGSTYIRDRRPVRLALSQYGHTLRPGPPGPFNAAAEAAGLIGHVRVIQVDRRVAEADIAARLDIPEGSEVIARVRHMALGDAEPEIVQISTSSIPIALVEGSPLAAEAATRIYASFIELGITPTTMSEEVTARMPMPNEAAALGLAPGQPVLVIERVTRDELHRPVELVRTVATADRLTLVYDELPIRSGD